MRVLVVEDDEDTAALVRAVLRRAGHVVEVATGAEDGHWLAVEFDFDVVVLDWELPDGTGVELCAALRAEERWAPILMLTGHAEVGRRVAGLNAGADDYLTKPFAPEELVARVHALGRRVPHERPTVLRHGDLEVDPAARSVRRAGQPVDLRPKEFALLELLMRRPGRRSAGARSSTGPGTWPTTACRTWWTCTCARCATRSTGPSAARTSRPCRGSATGYAPSEPSGAVR